MNYKAKTFLITLFICFFWNCEPKQSEKENKSSKDSIQLIVLDNQLSIKNKGFISYEIKNNSNQKIYVPLVNEYVQKTGNIKEEMHNDHFYIFLFDKNNEFIRANVGLSSWGPYFDKKDTICPKLEKLDSLVYETEIKPHKLIKTGLLENAKYTFYKRDSKIIKPKSKIEDTASIYLKLSQYNFSLAGDIYAYNEARELQNASFFQLILHVDSARMKKRLLPKDLDSLKNNKIELFHGTLYSNKVPIKLEKK